MSEKPSNFEIFTINRIRKEVIEGIEDPDERLEELLKIRRQITSRPLMKWKGAAEKAIEAGIEEARHQLAKQRADKYDHKTQEEKFYELYLSEKEALKNDGIYPFRKRAYINAINITTGFDESNPNELNRVIKFRKLDKAFKNGINLFEKYSVENIEPDDFYPDHVDDSKLDAFEKRVKDYIKNKY